MSKYFCALQPINSQQSYYERINVCNVQSSIYYHVVCTTYVCAGLPRGWEGPRANTKSGAHNID